MCNHSVVYHIGVISLDSDPYRCHVVRSNSKHQLCTSAAFCIKGFLQMPPLPLCRRRRAHLVAIMVMVFVPQRTLALQLICLRCLRQPLFRWLKRLRFAFIRYVAICVEANWLYDILSLNRSRMFSLPTIQMEVHCKQYGQGKISQTETREKNLSWLRRIYRFVQQIRVCTAPPLSYALRQASMQFTNLIAIYCIVSLILL